MGISYIYTARWSGPEMTTVIVNEESYVPYTSDNSDGRLVMEWVAQGNTIAEFVPEVEPTIPDIVSGQLAIPILIAIVRAVAARLGITPETLISDIEDEYP